MSKEEVSYVNLEEGSVLLPGKSISKGPHLLSDMLRSMDPRMKKVIIQTENQHYLFDRIDSYQVVSISEETRVSINAALLEDTGVKLTIFLKEEDYELSFYAGQPVIRPVIVEEEKIVVAQRKMFFLYFVLIIVFTVLVVGNIVWPILYSTKGREMRENNCPSPDEIDLDSN